VLRVYNGSEFPTASASGHTLAVAARGSWHIRIPRVLVEMLAPPVLREERIGKEMLAGVDSPSACLLFSVLL
jgi:hypothetical protein